MAVIYLLLMIYFLSGLAGIPLWLWAARRVEAVAVQRRRAVRAHAPEQRQERPGDEVERRRPLVVRPAP